MIRYFIHPDSKMDILLSADRAEDLGDTEKARNLRWLARVAEPLDGVERGKVLKLSDTQ